MVRLFYGINKLYLLMEKQHNRGQDGAGIATIKFDVKPGNRYISRYRAMGSTAVADIFEYVQKKFASVQKAFPEESKDTQWLKDNVSFYRRSTFRTFALWNAWKEQYRKLSPIFETKQLDVS